jgi:hypothetical protein|eukprot:COSAG01_NODE_8974_length_2597_cov_36.881906_3_plen_81_part_00
MVLVDKPPKGGALKGAAAKSGAPKAVALKREVRGRGCFGMLILSLPPCLSLLFLVLLLAGSARPPTHRVGRSGLGVTFPT